MSPATPGRIKVPTTQYAVKVGDLQWVRIPPGQSVARPEATRAMKDRTASVNKSSTRDSGQQPTVKKRPVGDDPADYGDRG